MIIFLGMAGSGKSTQGQILAEKKGWQWVSVGQLLRDTGKFQQLLQTGELADSETIEKLVGDKLDELKAAGQEVILDGHPRNMEQAQWLIDKYGDDIKVVIYVEVPKEELIERMEKRGRADDTREAIKRRFEIGEQNICSILSLLKSHNIRTEAVDGVGKIEDIAQRIEAVING